MKKESDVELTSSKISQKYTKILRAGSLLQEICERICKDSKTVAWVDKEEIEMEVEN